eukprot:gene13156-biopygen3569
MSRGTRIELELKMPIPRFARDRHEQLRYQLDSGEVINRCKFGASWQ